ncbi:transcription repressor OFP1-like [Musa acuminata AAA Group]|uniref:transcription repressor OFP1-like n=1 Tax=Musa acuminata AAA Group TaxID=214697 RepID=UPI0031D26769
MSKAGNPGLKHRFARALLRSSCTTTATTTASDLIKLSTDAPPRQEPESCARCRSYSRRCTHRIAPVVQVSMEMKAKKKERRVTENGDLYDTGAREGRKCPPASPSSPMRNWYYCSRDKDGKQKAHGTKGSSRRTETRKLLPTGDGFSCSSSLDCNDELGLFSDDDEEEEGSGTLLSSKSFSSDSSEFYCSNRGTRNKATATTKKKKKKRRSESFKSTRRPPRRGDRGSSKPWPLAARSSSTEKKAGFAVVKNSSDPYMDFRSSMVEMIVERGMSGASDMEDLLHSYLDLNSPLHHPVILEAFVDVWEAMLAEQYM